MLTYFMPRIVPVTFRDDPPNHVNVSLFKKETYERIKTNGVLVSPFGLMLAASVHYQTRHRKNPALRYLNAFFDTIESFRGGNYSQSEYFVLGGNESNEFQAKSSEVIGVGFCISLCKELFGIPRNRIWTIEATGRRMDFHFLKNGYKYCVEARARKDKIESAIDDIYQKKESVSNAANYGFITRTPRDGTPTSVVVVDPERDREEMPEHQFVQMLLRHYASLCGLAGFWRIANLLHRRADRIISYDSFRAYNKLQITFDNVLKLGHSYTVQIDNHEFAFFISRERDVGFRKSFNGHVAFIGINKMLIDVLVNQDFEALKEYKQDTRTSVSEYGIYILEDDGSMLGVVPEKMYLSN